MSAGHHKTVCECGRVISQCRCIGPYEVNVVSPCTHRPKPLREKRIVLICRNPRCQHLGLRRSIAWPYLGNDIFYKPRFVCVCGAEPSEVDESLDVLHGL